MFLDTGLKTQDIHHLRLVFFGVNSSCARWVNDIVSNLKYKEESPSNPLSLYGKLKQLPLIKTYVLLYYPICISAERNKLCSGEKTLKIDAVYHA